MTVDWWELAIKVAISVPALGNPWRLTIAQWMAALDRFEGLRIEADPNADDMAKAASIARKNRRKPHAR